MIKKSARLPLLKLWSSFFNEKAALVYLLAFAIAIGIATFIENDFGTDAAQKMVYKAFWFEVLLVLFSGTLIRNTIHYRFVQRKRWSLLLFHMAMVIIIIGAGLTRYMGFEGMMGIRQDEQSDTFLSADTHLNFNFFKNGREYQVDEPVFFASLGDNDFEKEYQIGNDLVKIHLKEFIPNPQSELVEDANGSDLLKIVMAVEGGRKEYLLAFGETRMIGGQAFNFTNTFKASQINVFYSDDQLRISSDQLLTQMTMATQEMDSLIPAQGIDYPLQMLSLYSRGSVSFVFADFQKSAKEIVVAGDAKVTNTSRVALGMAVTINGEKEEGYIIGQKGVLGRAEEFGNNAFAISIAYGAKVMKLPFSLKLAKFEMERYPGTNSPASFASDVKIIDDEYSYYSDYRIFMNHILDYRGYRFFQSSYDRDELGTYLSVNNDFWGTWISYLGYALLTLGMILTLVSRQTHFYELSQKIKKLRAARTLVLIGFLIGPLSLSSIQAQEALSPTVPTINKEHSDLFSRLIVQDVQGRMKPVHTLSREVMRKVYGSENFGMLNADQVILSLFANNEDWYSIPLIKLDKEGRLAEYLGMMSGAKHAAYSDFFKKDGSYSLSAEIQEANTKAAAERSVFDNALINADERVNIVNMLLSGYLLRLVPLLDDPNNRWVASQGGESPVAEIFFRAYRSVLRSNNIEEANALVQALSQFQQEQGEDVVPSENQQNAEIWLNNSKIFNRLAAVYSLLGLTFLVLLFMGVFQPNWPLSKAQLILVIVLLAAFAMHTIGLGLRWYVSERAPWSNGYESMIYIAWTSTLAGILFSRKSPGAMAATNILAGVVLLIAMLSYLNPEITPLVPVLKSYWLTIHVSLVAGSYGFLMLGAIIGLINLLLMIFLKAANFKSLRAIIREMSYISEMTLIGGLFMLSVGTYLGGVWANESWGRYWGWDAKETWALVSILVYAFILHMRLVPKVAGLFAFNFATLFGLSSIIMTYFGVNYYLSGLHSYAAGDPVPIPGWVYYAVLALMIISALAFWRARKAGLKA
jgi:cytochrome c-type biogenesis protein CcsB